MKFLPKILYNLLFLTILFSSIEAQAQRQMEKLGRGLVVLRTSNSATYLSWRMLATEPEDVAYNIYYSFNGGAFTLLNTSGPRTTTTDYSHAPGTTTLTNYPVAYYIKAVIGGVEQAASPTCTLPANAPIRQYISWPLHAVTSGTAGPYNVKFCWVGDLDGDGEYDYVVDRISTVAAANEYLQAYKRDGTFLWQMDMGPNSANQYNIEPGASAISIGHGDGVTVYDMDGDGKAEVMVRTARNVVYGDGTVIPGSDDTTQSLSVINGLTGAQLARATIPNPWPSDGPMNGHMAIMYCDGTRPSVVWHAENRNASEAFQRIAVTWDYRNGALTQRWFYQTPLTGANQSWGHQIRLMDVNHDGCDDLIDVGSVKDGKTGLPMFDTEIVHGDRFYTTDMDPDRPGLETYCIQQNNSSLLATALYNSDTGAMIRKWYRPYVVDVGRGDALDLNPSVLGVEMFSTQPGMWDCKGNLLGYATSQPTFPVISFWWDADLQREFMSGANGPKTTPTIDKWTYSVSYPEGANGRLFSVYNDLYKTALSGTNLIAAHQADGGRPAIIADMLGDWREETVLVANDYSELRVYCTKIAATNRLYCLMQNPGYRVQCTAKGYYQSSNVDYYLGNGMQPPAPPPFSDTTLVWKGNAAGNAWDTSTPNWVGSWFQTGTAQPVSTYAQGNSVLFDVTGTNSTPVSLSGTFTPGSVLVHTPKPYTFGGTGMLSGTMKLTKAGGGSLTLTGSHNYTGATLVAEGALIVNGTLANSPVTVRGGVWLDGAISGTGVVASAVSIQPRGAVSPGSGTNSIGTLTISGSLSETNACNRLDLSNSPAGSNDRVNILGNLSLSGTNILQINPTAGTLGSGTYTLITYTGALTGGTANLTVRGVAGVPCSVVAGSGAISLVVNPMRAASPTTWAGTGGMWNLASSQSWLKSGTADVFVTGDAVTFDNTGASAPVASLSGALYPASVAVNSGSNYTFSGTGYLSGTTGIAKSGSGTLTIQTSNDFTGPVSVTGGVLEVTSVSETGYPSSIGASGTATTLTLNGGTLRFSGGDSVTDRGIAIGSGGATLDVPSTDAVLVWKGRITGSAGLTKSGAGTLILNGSNSYTGGTTITGGGMISLADDTTSQYGLGSGPITLVNGTLKMFDDSGSYSNSYWAVNIPAGGNGTILGDSRVSLYGALTGSGGTLNYYIPYVRTDFYGNWSAFNGQLNLTADAGGGDFRIQNTYGYAGTAMDVAANVNVYYVPTMNSNLTISIGALSGAAGGELFGGPTGGRTLTWSVGARNIDSTFAGSIFNGTGPTALTKVGTATLTLTGSSNYSGATTVSGGNLRVDGILNGSTVTVANGARLAGSGIIGGNVTVQAGGALGNGGTSASTLNILGNLTMSGGTLYFGLSNNTGSGNDLVQLTGGTLSMNGSYTVTPTYLDGSLISGTYTLITGGTSTVGAPTLVWGGTNGETVSFETSTPGTVKIVVTAAARAPGTVIWTGSDSSAWDYSATNWKFGSADTAFMAGDSAVFDDTMVSGTAGITSVVDPRSILVSNNTKALTISGTLGGIINSGTLTKTGTGTLTMTGSNSFTGGVVLNGGSIILANDTATQYALGTGTATLVSGTLRMYDNTATYSSFNWPLVVPSGANAAVLADSRVDVNSTLTGSGTLNFNVPWVRTTLLGNWSGFSGRLNATTSSGGVLRLSNTAGYGNAAINVGPGVSVQSYLNATTTIAIGELSGDATATLTGMNNNNNPSGSYTLTWLVGAKNTDSVFDGRITNGTSPSITALTKTGSGALVLTSTNSSYAGGTTINGGTLAANILANGGSPSSTGTSSNAAANLVINGGTLQYTGSGATTDRRFTLGTSGGALDASGLGAIIFSNTNALTVAGSNTARILTLDGSNYGDNTLAASIGNNGSGATSLLKIGSGKWVLTGNSSYTGLTTVAAGILKISGSLSSSSTIMVLSGGTLDLNTALNVGSVDVQEGGTLTGAGKINNFSNEGTIALTSGTLTLNGNSLVNNGTMRLSGNAALVVLSGTFVNNGVFDVMTSSKGLPANFVNNGVVLDASAVKVQQVARVANDVVLTIQSYPGHDYQLQRRATLTSGTWENIGLAQPGTGEQFNFTDTDAASVSHLFYRFLVTP